MKLIDTHAHLQFPQFDGDREAVIRRLHEAGLGVINVGTDAATSKAAVVLAADQPNFWATVGLHPTDWREGFDHDWFKQVAGHPKVVAVGECGLDYYRETRHPKQQEIFEQQIALALELNKPLMIHCRNAYAEVIEILKNFPAARGVIHFFTGGWPLAQQFLDLDFVLSFSGVITFARDYDESIKKAPLEKILAETDCPFATPLPHRGSRNEPIYVKEVVRQIAALRRQPLPLVAEALLANADRAFGLGVDKNH